MNYKLLDQGSIIYGLRSDKYVNNKCYGIVITASCDIANRKVSKIYYIIGIEVDEWIFSNAGFNLIYKDKIKQLKFDCNKGLNKYNLDMDSILSFSDKEIEKVLHTYSVNKDLLTKIKEIRRFIDDKILTRREIIRSTSKIVKDFLIKINKGEVYHYYYLPQSAYLNNSSNEKGIIVDFQEINFLPFEDVMKIYSPGIDYQIFEAFKKDDQERYKKIFWLENKEDFVMICDSIFSPWREHLIQRFSNSFARIGLDGAVDSDFEKITKRLTED